MEYVLLLLIFALTFGITLGGYYLFSRSARRLEQRLRGGTGSDPKLGSDPTLGSDPKIGSDPNIGSDPRMGSDPGLGSKTELLLGDLTPALAGAMPMGEQDRADLQRELKTAGYYRPTALMEYAALRWTLVIVPILMAGALALFTETARSAAYFWIAGLILAVLGYSLPRIYLYYRGKARKAAIERGLPTMLDMMTLCLGAGLNILLSLRKVTREMRLPHPVLAEEMAIVSRQAELRTLDFALVQFADRVDLPALRNISMILSQSENLGTDAAAILREYSDNLRVEAKQRADETANKAPFKMLFPAFLLAIGAGILLISPIALEFSEFRQTGVISNSIRDAKGTLEQLRKESIDRLTPRPAPLPTPEEPEIP